MIARKDHKCYWCGETIPSGSKYESFRMGVTQSTGNTKLVAYHYHSECRDAKDQATLHGFGEVAEGRCERGEYACPNDTNGDGDCALCCDTPFRRLLRGDKKPALTSGEMSRRFQEAALDALRNAGL